MLAQFEQHIESDSRWPEGSASIVNKYLARYRDYTIRELCQEMQQPAIS